MNVLVAVFALLALLACHSKAPGGDGVTDTVDTRDTVDTAPTSDGGTPATDTGVETGTPTDTGSPTDTGDTGSPTDTGDTGDTGTVCVPSESPFTEVGTGTDDHGPPDAPWDVDADEDGWSIGEGDCDERDATVNPGRVEIPGNGIDEDCDGSDAGPTLRLDTATWAWHGEEGYQAGYNVAFAGDTNGDGRQEVLLSAPDMGLAPGTNSHYELVTLGATSTEGPLATTIDLGGGGGANLGLAAGGDLNGDGYDDFVTGDIYDSNTGAAFVYLGPVTGALTEDDADFVLSPAYTSAQFSYSMAFVPNPDHRGRVSLVVGAPHAGSTGAAYLWDEVTTSGNQETASAAFYGSADDGRAGHHAQSAGDVDADGINDLLVPEYDADLAGSKSGQVYVVSGPFGASIDLAATAPALVGEGESSYAGMGDAGIGDINNDGYDDVLIGGPLDPEIGTRAGKAWIVHGPVTATQSLSDADVRLLPETDYEWFGFDVAGLGDVNRDDQLDIAVSAPRDYYYGLDMPGKVYIFSAPLSGTISAADASLVIAGRGIGDWAGAAIDGGRDVDNDCLPDLLIAAPLRDAVAPNAGEVDLLTGLSW